MERWDTGKSNDQREREQKNGVFFLVFRFFVIMNGFNRWTIISFKNIFVNLSLSMGLSSVGDREMTGALLCTVRVFRPSDLCAFDLV